MKKSIKKLLAVLISVLIIVCISVNSFLATTYYVLHGFVFYKNNNGLTITEYQNEVETLVIPDSIIDINVIAIGPSAFEGRSDISAVVMSDNVITIASFAFSGDERLSDIVFSKNLTNIYTGAFQSCQALENVDLSDTKLAYLDNQVFYDCSNLKSVALPDTCTEIHNFSFAECPSLEFVCIPASVTLIEEYAFMNTTGFSIKGFSGSYAEQYANEHNIPFICLDEEEYEMGDVNLDGYVNIKDATAIQKHIAMIELLSEKGCELADVDNDDYISVLDATQIQKIIAELV